MSRIIRLVLGSILLLVGMAGLVLPILQGWLFLGLGVMILAKDIPMFARVERWAIERYPRLGRRVERLKGSFSRVRKLN